MVSRKCKLEHVIQYFGVTSGDYSEEVTPVPISNTEVKLLCADDTWWATARESRTLPVLKDGPSGRPIMRPHGQAVKTSPFHGGNTSSSLVGVTT